MENPRVIGSSAKLVELQIMQGKLEANGIECMVCEQTFQGPGKLHKLLVSMEDEQRASEVLSEK